MIMISLILIPRTRVEPRMNLRPFWHGMSEGAFLFAFYQETAGLLLTRIQGRIYGGRCAGIRKRRQRRKEGNHESNIKRWLL